MLSTQKFDVGQRVIFLPYEPGLFIALTLPATDFDQLMSDTQSVNSLSSN